MAPVALKFPKNAQPGQRPTEGNGALVNAAYERHGDDETWRRTPGLTHWVDSTKSSPRGAYPTQLALLCCYSGGVYELDSAGARTDYTGSPGSGTKPASWAANNAATPDVVVVTDSGAFSVDTVAKTVTAFADADLPAGPNDVACLDGYLLFSYFNGRIYATGLNAATVDPLAFATAESSPDALVRGIVHGSSYLAMGFTSIEVWQNASTSPFPLSRAAVIPCGLMAKYAVAGFGRNWDLQPIWVALDGTVRRLTGYEAQVVSTPDVERDIRAVPFADRESLWATCYVEGSAMWVLQGPSWTWEYDAVRNSWHKRESAGLDYWRYGLCAPFWGTWRAFELGGSRVLNISESAYKEGDHDLEWSIESADRSHPMRLAIAQAAFDLSKTDASAPVTVQWSKDGGETWSSGLTRDLADSGFVKVRRIGRTTTQGIRFRLSSTANAPIVCRGGTIEYEVRA
jgi:hypothetical protein